MARQTRPVSIQVIERGDYLDIAGFGDCKVLSTANCISESFDITRVWVVSPYSQIVTVCLPCDTPVNLVELVTDDKPDVEETTQTVRPVSLRRGDTFYFGRIRVTAVTSGWKHPGSVHFITSKGKTYHLSVSPTLRLRRVVTTRKAKPLSFSEFALSTYAKTLDRLAEAVSRLQMDPARVEVQKPAKKAENASSVITTKDVPSPAPVVPETKSRACECDEDCDRSYCVEFDASKIAAGTIDPDNIRTKYSDHRLLTCSDVIAELEEVRQHEGDLPVSIVSPEDGFRRVNVSGSMLEDLYEHGETYWGSRTWDTQPRPGHSNKSDLVVSLW